MKQLTDTFHIKHHKVASYNHKGNGKVENIHGEIKDMLRAFLHNYPNDWDLLLPLFEMAYNGQIHNVTGFSPYQLQFGRPLNYPSDADIKAQQPLAVPHAEYIQLLKENQPMIFDLV
jgi:hypothetical protein